jgi:hypothetical protein
VIVQGCCHSSVQRIQGQVCQQPSLPIASNRSCIFVLYHVSKRVYASPSRPSPMPAQSYASSVWVDDIQQDTCIIHTSLCSLTTDLDITTQLLCHLWKYTAMGLVHCCDCGHMPTCMHVQGYCLMRRAAVMQAPFSRKYVIKALPTKLCVIRGVSCLPVFGCGCSVQGSCSGDHRRYRSHTHQCTSWLEKHAETSTLTSVPRPAWKGSCLGLRGPWSWISF